MRYVWPLLALLLFSSELKAVQPAESQLAAYEHAKRLNPEEAYVSGFLSVPDFLDAKEKWAVWAAVAGHSNFLSTCKAITSPEVVLRNGQTRRWPNIAEGDFANIILIRLNITDYGWTRSQWDKLGNPELEPFFHVRTLIPGYPAGKNPDGTSYPEVKAENAIALAPWLSEPLGLPSSQPARDIYVHRFRQAAIGLSVLTGYSQSPIVEARNFIHTTAVDFDRKGAGYYSWFGNGIKNKKDFDKLVRFDASLSPLREAVSDSGVAVQPRRIERFGRGDGYHITYDQVNQRGIGKRNPLTTLDDTFLFDASEIIGRLDNGLWAFGLFDKDGVLQQSAPDGVGYNHRTRSNDGKINAGPKDCLGCHDSQPGRGGLHSYSPYFRNLYAEPGPIALAVKNPFKLPKFRDLYLTSLDKWFEVDRLIYTRALLETNGLLPHQYAAVLNDVYHSYERPLDIEMAAREHGVTAAELQRALQQTLLTYGILDNVSANWCLPPQRRQLISRDAFTENYNSTQLSLRGLPPGGWPAELRVRYPRGK